MIKEISGCQNCKPIERNCQKKQIFIEGRAQMNNLATQAKIIGQWKIGKMNRGIINNKKLKMYGSRIIWNNVDMQVDSGNANVLVYVLVKIKSMKYINKNL